MIPLYYSSLMDQDDALCRTVFQVRDEKYKAARRYMNETMRSGGWIFHDWMVEALHLEYAPGRSRPDLKLTLADCAGRQRGSLECLGVEALSMQGELVGQKLSFPGGHTACVFAQILDIWAERTDALECAILLVNQRYIKVKCWRLNALLPSMQGA